MPNRFQELKDAYENACYDHVDPHLSKAIESLLDKWKSMADKLDEPDDEPDNTYAADMAHALKLFAEVEQASIDKDDERAHGKEDTLQTFALEAISRAASLDKAKAFAKLALKTGSLDFSRWCA